MDDQATSRSLFITGLRNAHAMENQALAIMNPQLERIENYPDIAERLRQHIRETEGQRDRLERLLEDCGADKSVLKDAALSIAGTFAALGHTPAPDEILKNSFADFAFENYEIAAYNSLIVLAELSGQSPAVATLRQNLAEEEAMARWLSEHLAGTTRKYAALRAEGETAKH